VTAEATVWSEANHRYLVAALAEVRTAVSGAFDALPEHEWDAPGEPALESLVRLAGLSRFERAVLLLCAGREVDAGFAEACGTPTFGLALATLPDAHWSALAPAAPLRHWRMIELGDGTLTSAPLMIDERILHYLVGVQYLDGRLEGFIGPPVAAGELPPSHEAVAEAIAEMWLRDKVETPVALLGPDAGAKPSIAALACARLGMGLRTVSAAAIPAAAVEQEGLRRLWTREVMLDGAALLVDCEDAEPRDTGDAAVAFVEQIGVPVLVAAAQPLRHLRRPVLRVDVERPAAAEQRAVWERALGQDAAELNGTLDALVAQFDFGTRALEAARLQAGQPRAGEPPAARVWDACRAQARPRLDDLAERIEPRASWGNLVLPEPQRDLLKVIAEHVRHRVQVYERWGFAAQSARGLGISALFVGGSGTGKTMAAEVLARELRLDLYRIDLSSVVSKYIGETEKNLRRVFDAAEESGTVLLFDEADALFGKRTEVKDSHDRYANIEVSYLLQRMEAYRGLAILTTNFRTALDTAFLRRLRFIVEFPFPNAAQREEIWRRIFPAATPTAELDLARLAQLSVAGGSVRNIALNAAFFAAEADVPVEMSHVLRAARAEYAKLEKPLTGAEIGGWS
jgi:ATPase family associated with various cellular activities (AAA)/Winged helix domain, variant